MTWPFENDTSVIVKKLAKRNVSSNRIFCFFNVLTIALAISLIVGISLFQQGSKISEQKILNQMQQAMEKRTILPRKSSWRVCWRWQRRRLRPAT